MVNSIGIVILATNAYFILGLRFIKKYLHHYKGNSRTTFYFFSDQDPNPFLPQSADVEYFFVQNNNWVDGTNLKFKSILRIKESGKLRSNYLYYFDADTNITRDFTEDWFLGDMVGGQHYGDQGWMKEVKGFDRNPKSKAYVPFDTVLPQMYFYGAFFGGRSDLMMSFCETLKSYQDADRLIPYEPGCNDESYINREFHFNPPTKVVLCPDFAFGISDKGGMGDTRNMKMDISGKLREIESKIDEVFDIKNNQIVWI